MKIFPNQASVKEKNLDYSFYHTLKSLFYEELVLCLRLHRNKMWTALSWQAWECLFSFSFIKEEVAKSLNMISGGKKS